MTPRQSLRLIRRNIVHAWQPFFPASAMDPNQDVKEDAAAPMDTHLKVLQPERQASC
jgi:hypothetical protein